MERNDFHTSAAQGILGLKIKGNVIVKNNIGIDRNEAAAPGLLFLIGNSENFHVPAGKIRLHVDFFPFF